MYPITKGAIVRRKVGEQRAVDGISFDIREGECLALVGESGCGKTTTLMEIMQLRTPQEGVIRIGGTETGALTRKDRAALRSDITMVFQDPMASLDPRMPIADIIKEPMRVQGYSKERMDERVDWLLKMVGLLPEHAARFPTEFSGGQRQRVGVARALACDPKLIVLDEPTSALDVTVQAGVLAMLADLRARLGVSFLFVSHDLSVVRHISDRIAVMQKGKIVELGDRRTSFPTLSMNTAESCFPRCRSRIRRSRDHAGATSSIAVPFRRGRERMMDARYCPPDLGESSATGRARRELSLCPCALCGIALDRTVNRCVANG